MTDTPTAAEERLAGKIDEYGSMVRDHMKLQAEWRDSADALLRKIHSELFEVNGGPALKQVVEQNARRIGRVTGLLALVEATLVGGLVALGLDLL